MLDTVSSPHDRAEDHRDLLSGTVEDTVREHLGGDKIVLVSSRHSEDFDGDRIVSINVVINTSPSNFDPRRLSSLVRVLRASLAEIGITAFPMVSYMNEAEQKLRSK